MQHKAASRPRPPEERVWRFVHKGPGCWSWTGYSDKVGRGFFNPGNGRTSLAAARYIWEITRGAIPDKTDVCHNCPGGDNPNCVNPDHLFLASRLEHIRDSKTKGQLPDRSTGPKGERVHTAVLTEDDVCAIRAVPKSPGSGVRLAQQYGVSPQTICRIRQRKIWKHVP